MKPSSRSPQSVCISPVVSPYGSKSRGGCLSCASLETHEFHTMFNTAPILRLGVGCVYPIEGETGGKGARTIETEGWGEAAGGDKMLMAGMSESVDVTGDKSTVGEGRWGGVERETTERGALTPDLGHPDALWGWPQRLLW